MTRHVTVLSLILLLFCGGLLLDASTGFAAITLVDSVDVTAADPRIEINLNFGMPLQYINHTPRIKGDLLQIEMRAIGDMRQVTGLNRRNNLSWIRTDNRLITEISYEANAKGQVQLLLRFAQEVYFNQIGSADLRHLKIVATHVDTVTKPPDEQNRYAINLRSQLHPIKLSNLPQSEVLKQYQLYTTTFEQKGRLWHRLRLGFFPDKQAADEVFELLKKAYPGAWVTLAPISEHIAARKMTQKAEVAAVEKPPSEEEKAEKPSVPVTEAEELLESGTQPPTPEAIAPVPAVTPPIPPVSVPPASGQEAAATTSPADQREQELLDEAESAMISESYRRAIQIYTKLAQSSDPAVRQQAQEFLGLARERNNQLAHAKAEYEKYLELYPEGEGAERVKQRLAGLLTARATPKEKLRKAKQPLSKGAWRTEAYGSFSQFYDNTVTSTDDEGNVTDRSALSSDLDVNVRFRNDNYDIRTTFIGGLENDFLDDGEDEVIFNSLYFDALARKLNLSTRIGRQSRSSGGVLGRFDGGLLRWQMNDSIAVNLIGGYPVVSTRDTEIDTDRPLYGISFDLGTFAKRWNFNSYFITQDVDGILDREAIGGEIRYFAPSLSFFSLVDYDTSYSKLNTALLTANWVLPTKTSFNMSIDYRNSPILTTSNALIGQPVDSISALKSMFTEDEIRQLALDRTASSQTYTLGITQPLSQKLQISGDVTATKFSSTPASGNVLAQPGTDFEYFYSLQLIGSSLIKEGDIAILGLRYSDSTTSNVYSATVNTRYPVTREFRVNPRASLDYRTSKTNDSEQWTFRPLIRLEYVLKRRYHFEIEGGFEWASNEIAGLEEERQGSFFTVGYRIDYY